MNTADRHWQMVFRGHAKIDPERVTGHKHGVIVQGLIARAGFTAVAERVITRGLGGLLVTADVDMGDGSSVQFREEPFRYVNAELEYADKRKKRRRVEVFSSTFFADE